MKISVEEMIDATEPKSVEVLLDENGKTLWVNIDGICRLKVKRIEEIIFSGPVLKYHDKE